MATFVGKRDERWARQVVAVLEVELKRRFAFAWRGGRIFIFPQEDCGTPREALEVFRNVSKHLPGAIDGFDRLPYIWLGEEMPVGLDDAYVKIFDGKVFETESNDWETMSHPLGGGTATTGLER